MIASWMPEIMTCGWHPSGLICSAYIASQHLTDFGVTPGAGFGFWFDGRQVGGAWVNAATITNVSTSLVRPPNGAETKYATLRVT